MTETPSRDPLTVQVDAADERAVIVAALVRAGATKEDAGTQADVLVEGDLRGHPSHGLRRLPVLVNRLRAGLLTSGRGISTEWLTPAAVMVDGRRGLGPAVAFAAIDCILDRVDHQGIALASIQNSGHIGMLAPYVESIVKSGCVALALTTSEALVHPWGGVRAMLGTNPIGIGVPTLTEPLILDMSTSATSMGKIIEYAATGQSLPIGWAIGGDGEPTNDPNAAMTGAVSPFGGPKGYALGLALEAFVALLTTTSLGTEVTGTLDTTHLSTKGDVFIAISLSALGVNGHLPEISRYLAAIRQSGREGPVLVPGDRARRTRARCLETGISIPIQLWERVNGLASGEE